MDPCLVLYEDGSSYSSSRVLLQVHSEKKRMKNSAVGVADLMTCCFVPGTRSMTTGPCNA
jgi:hypothetical protein